ncbi:MAG: CrcB family protein [Pseudomonadota bacterium]
MYCIVRLLCGRSHSSGRGLSVGAAIRLTGETAWGTLFVNVIGSLVMGILFVVIIERMPESWGRLGPFAMAGVLGAFTTFSAFSLDVLRMIEQGRNALAAAYISGSVALSVLALVAGVLIARAVIA